jgi:hypothetical protein
MPRKPKVKTEIIEESEVVFVDPGEVEFQELPEILDAPAITTTASSVMVQEEPPAVEDLEWEIPSQERNFVLEYVLDWNVPRAAERSGYAKKDVARCYAMLRRPDIRAYLEEVCRQFGLTKEEVGARVAAIARGAWTDYLMMDENHIPYLDIERMKADGMAWLIEGFTVTNTGSVRWEFAKSQRSLTAMGKTLGVISEAPSEEREANAAFTEMVRAMQRALPDQE